LLSIGDVSVSESGGTATLTVRLSPPNLAASVTVDWSTSAGSAVEGGDYMASSGTLTFAAGEDEKTIAVPIIDDAGSSAESDEVFEVSSRTRRTRTS
jgi:hypothetical protein